MWCVGGGAESESSIDGCCALFFRRGEARPRRAEQSPRPPRQNAVSGHREDAAPRLASAACRLSAVRSCLHVGVHPPRQLLAAAARRGRTREFGMGSLLRAKGEGQSRVREGAKLRLRQAHTHTQGTHRAGTRQRSARRVQPQAASRKPGWRAGGQNSRLDAQALSLTPEHATPSLSFGRRLSRTRTPDARTNALGASCSMARPAASGDSLTHPPPTATAGRWRQRQRSEGTHHRTNERRPVKT